jgi:hypothetical protein
MLAAAERDRDRAVAAGDFNWMNEPLSRVGLANEITARLYGTWLFLLFVVAAGLGMILPIGLLNLRTPAAEYPTEGRCGDDFQKYLTAILVVYSMFLIVGVFVWMVAKFKMGPAEVVVGACWGCCATLPLFIMWVWSIVIEARFNLDWYKGCLTNPYNPVAHGVVCNIPSCIVFLMYAYMTFIKENLAGNCRYLYSVRIWHPDVL